MSRAMVKLFWVVAFVLVLFPVDCWALDVLKAYSVTSERDPRYDFERDLFDEIMRATERDFGPYRIEFVGNRGSQERELVEMVLGEIVNADIIATRPEWEERTIPIRIPLLKGMLGVRLFLVRRDHAPLFAKVRTLDELKALSMGLHRTWTITRMMRGRGFTLVEGVSYEGLFRMLDHGHFDYFPRGLTEIYRELDARRDQYPEMMVEPTLALVLPLPQFIFVSPKEPRLAERLETGLRRIMDNGAYDLLFDRYYGDMYERAQMDKRRVFTIANPALTPETRRVLGQ